MLALTIKLLLAHLVGDFLLQPNKWIEDKIARKHKSSYLYYHITIHALSLLIILQFDFSFWLGIVLILVSHFLFDWCKLLLHDKVNPILLFFTDQVLHLGIIAAVIFYYIPFSMDISMIHSPKTLLLLTALLSVTFVSSIIIKVLILKWKINEEQPNNAGKYIGMLERLFIFSFILINYWEGIGFLLAAKSVFRFGDLNNAKDRNLTEYILIGTLLSFGLAMISAVMYKHLSTMI